MIVGLGVLWKRRRDLALFLVLPLILAAVASAAQAYPFTAQLFAFLLPRLLLATAVDVDWMVAVLPSRASFITPAVLAVAGGAPLYAAATALPPSRLQHLRPIVQEIQARRVPDDPLYVYYATSQAF